MEQVPDWQIHIAKDYATYEVEDDEHLAMGVSLYIPLDPNHRNNGEFRLAILGGGDEEVCVPAIDVYNILPKAVAGTMLHFAFSSIKTLIPRNCTSCPWQDATSLIRKVAYYLRILFMYPVFRNTQVPYTPGSVFNCASLVGFRDPDYSGSVIFQPSRTVDKQRQLARIYLHFSFIL
jgi:hypothetical protein